MTGAATHHGIGRLVATHPLDSWTAPHLSKETDDRTTGETK